MRKRYKIGVETNESELVGNPSLKLTLQSSDFLERKFSTQSDDIFAESKEDFSIWAKIKAGAHTVFAPIFRPAGISNFGVFAIFVFFVGIMRKTILSIIPFPIKNPFLRGWRLEVVRKVALDEGNPVPGVRPDLLFNYYGKGLVLLFMRWLYFLPLVIILFLSGKGILGLATEIWWYIRDVLIGTESMGIGQFIFQKVIPEALVDLIIQMVLLGFYVVLVWPIYRLIMIQYALKLTRAGGFIDVQVIKKSIKIFRRHALTIYGIYGFVVALDVFVAWFAKIALFSTGFLFLLVAFIYYLLFRYWVKGYAYGVLGKRLIEAGAFDSDNYTPQSEEEDDDDSSFVI